MDYRKTLTSRYVVTLSEYMDNIYLHILDTRLPVGDVDKRKMKRITLHAEALFHLEELMPEIMALVREHEESKREEGDDDEGDECDGGEEEDSDEEVVVKKKTKKYQQDSRGEKELKKVNNKRQRTKKRQK